MKNYYLLVAMFLMSFWHAVAQCDVSENFDTYSNNDVPTGWTVVTPAETNAYAKVATLTTGLPSGTRMLRMYSGNATADSGELLFISPMSESVSDGNYRLTFFVKASATVVANLIVGTMDAADGTFTAVSTVSEFDGEFHEYKIAIPAGTDQYFAFKHDLAGTNNTFDIDNICLQEIPTCLEVSDITVDSKSANSVSFSWAASDSEEGKWQTAVLKSAEDEPISGVVDVEETTTDTVEGLDPNTVYYIFVRAYCGDTDGYGAWIGPVAFRTDCATLTGDFCEYLDDASYANGDTPFCWTSINDFQFNSNFGIYKSYNGSPSGEYMFRLAISSNSDEELNSMLISPASSVATDGMHRVTFMARSSKEGTGVIVGTMTDPSDVSTFTEVATVYPNYGFSLDSFQEYKVTLPSNEDTYFAFKHDNINSSTYVSLDNICLETLPSCLEVESIEVANVTNSSVDILWTASPSEETAWEYVVLEGGADMPTSETSGMSVEDAATVTVDTDLVANTKYDVYVRANCGETDGFGAWQGPITFTTLCAPFEAPFRDGFENGENNVVIPPCWSTIVSAGSFLKTYKTSYSIGAIEGSVMASISISASMTENSVALISSEFSDLSADKEISVQLTRRDSGSPDFVLEVGTVSSPDNLDSFVLLDDTTITNATLIPTQWDKYTITLENYNAELEHKFIAFRPKQNGTVAFTVFMDDFRYEVNESLSVSEVAFENLTLYPNPAENVINIAGAKVSNVAIYTINGQKINAGLSNNSVDVSHLQSGFYFLEMTTDNGVVGRRKFIKK